VRASTTSSVARRKLARKYHPDVSKEPDADTRMKEINEVYEVLGDVEKRDLHLDLPVAPWVAALGAGVRVPTPDGAVEMRIPPDSANGRTLRLKGRGLPGNPPGDVFVHISVMLTEAGSEKAKQI